MTIKKFLFIIHIVHPVPTCCLGLHHRMGLDHVCKGQGCCSSGVWGHPGRSKLAPLVFRKLAHATQGHLVSSCLQVRTSLWTSWALALQKSEGRSCSRLLARGWGVPLPWFSWWNTCLCMSPWNHVIKQASSSVFSIHLCKATISLQQSSGEFHVSKGGEIHLIQPAKICLALGIRLCLTHNLALLRSSIQFPGSFPLLASFSPFREPIQKSRCVPWVLEWIQARLVPALFFSLLLWSILHSFLCPPWMVLCPLVCPIVLMSGDQYPGVPSPGSS